MLRHAIARRSPLTVVRIEYTDKIARLLLTSALEYRVSTTSNSSNGCSYARRNKRNISDMRGIAGTST